VNLTAFAPAKVNLFLHVGALEASGYHPVKSLMAFADVGDTVSLSAADALAFDLDGPFAGPLAEAGNENLVMRAARALLERRRGPTPPFRLLLTKRLPVAAGLGGGSSDAGAALRLLNRALGIDLAGEGLLEIAAALGSDGPACLYGAPVLAEGRGERLCPAPRLPPLHAVLVNPGTPCPTGPVYRAFDERGSGDAAAPILPEGFEDAQELAGFLSVCRNDLEGPAIAVAPVIAEALDLLRGEPETLLARLSGSGATCFALTASDIEAAGLAERLAGLRPGWWVAPCRLGGPWPD
jgi:4-diphosphocytidyl-2-C-methyl-D-erythritol kinase